MRRPIIGQFPPASWYWNQIQTRSWNYRSIPDSPEFSNNPITLVQANLGVAGQLRMADIGTPVAARDITLSGNFTDGISFNALTVGTASVPFRVKGTGVIGTTTKGLANIGNCSFMEIYGNSIASPMVVNAGGGTPEVGGQSGVNWAANATKQNLTMQNMVFQNTVSSGQQINSNAATGNYGIVRGSFLRGIDMGREWQYYGNTGDAFALFDEVTLQDCLGAEMDWDPGQYGHITALHLKNNTYYNGGKLNQSGQNHLIQVVDANGLIENCIFDGAPRICNLSTHGITFRNCLFRYSSATERGFIGRTDNLTYYPTARHNGEPILFENCYFIADTGAILTGILDVRERIADVEVRDCVFSSNIVSLFTDLRVAGFSNDLIGTISTNGNTSSSLLTVPTYTNFDVADYANHGLLTNNDWLQEGMGYRT